ncbi:MAG: helix-turn-helix domain-containing protein [Phycisphaerales bacterium]
MAKDFNQLVHKTMSKAARDRADERARQIMAELLLSEIRQAVGPTQKELADRLGIAQPTLSRLEKQSDMQVSTLQRVVEALGGELWIEARFPKGTVAIRQFAKHRKSSHRRMRKMELA